MYDLISRNAVRDGMMKYGFQAPDMTVHEFVEDELPSVPAVPLDKLCELCEEIDAAAPCALCDMCDKIMPEWCKQNNNPQLKCGEEWECPTWKQLLTKWMEEQEANDNR